jgi:hypothetical protein
MYFETATDFDITPSDYNGWNVLYWMSELFQLLFWTDTYDCLNSNQERELLK